MGNLSTLLYEFLAKKSTRVHFSHHVLGNCPRVKNFCLSALWGWREKVVINDLLTLHKKKSF